MRESICLYCQNCISCRKKIRSLSQCKNFKQEIPFPLTKKEFEETYKITRNRVIGLKRRYLNKCYLTKYRERQLKIPTAKPSRVKSLIKAINNQRERILTAFYYSNLYKLARHPLDFSPFDIELAKKKLFGDEKWL